MLLVTDAAGSAAAPDTTVPPFVAEDGSFTIISMDFNPDNQDGGTSGPSAITVAPVVRDEVAAPAEVPDGSHNVKLAVVSSCMHRVQMVLLHFF